MPRQDQKSEIVKMMNQYDQIYRKGDTAGLRRVRYPEFVFTSSRAARMSNEEELSAFEDGSSRIEKLEF